MTDSGVMDLSAQWPTLQAALSASMDAISVAGQAASNLIPLNEVMALEAPISMENRIFCVGVNYANHAAEAGRAAPEWPSLFLRHAHSFVGADSAVIKPKASDQFDYEAELAVVIGKAGRDISETDAMEHVAGYTCLADNSVRDFQKHSTQVTAGKNFDASGAVGPWIVTADEAPRPEDMTVKCQLNGDIVQTGNVSDMIFSVPQLIAYISTFTCLQPGDVIATGTPEGVGFKRNPPLFLKNGDMLSVEIDGVGTLTNHVVDEMDMAT